MSRSKDFLRVVFMRHGDHRNNHLTALGAEQVKKTADRIAQFNVGEIIVMSSPQSRALESAKILSGRFGLDGCPQIVDALDEGAVTQNPFGFIDVLNAAPRNVSTIVAVTHEPNVKACGAMLGAVKLTEEFGTGRICWANLKHRDADLDMDTVLNNMLNRTHPSAGYG